MPLLLGGLGKSANQRLVDLADEHSPPSAPNELASGDRGGNRVVWHREIWGYEEDPRDPGPESR